MDCTCMLLLCCSRQGTHSHTMMMVGLTRAWPDHWEQFGVQCLTKGQFNMWIEGVGEQTTNLAINGPPAPPPEL